MRQRTQVPPPKNFFTTLDKFLMTQTAGRTILVLGRIHDGTLKMSIFEFRNEHYHLIAEMACVTPCTFGLGGGYDNDAFSPKMSLVTFAALFTPSQQEA